MPKVILAREADLPLEGWEDRTRGTCHWRTFFSGDRDPTNELCAGIAYLDVGGTLNPHRHDAAEIYFVLEGAPIVTVDGVEFPLAVNSGLFIPANAEHGTVNPGPGPARFFYAFARDRFSEVVYRFAS